MQIKYLPRLNADYSQIPGRDIAFAILLPDGYNTSKKWKWGIAVHGQGELSPGALVNLENLVEGFDYNGDGIREGAAFVTDSMKWAVDAHQLIMVIPTYNNFLEPADVDKIYDYMLANYSVQNTFMHTGFSLGGGCVFKYASSSDTRAKRVHLAIPCAGVSSLVSASVAAKNGTVWHAFANDGDKRVGASNTTSQIDKINGQAPTIKALYTLFHRDVPNADNHGGNNEAWDKIPPKAPGGHGFTDAAETIYQLNDAILTTGPRQMKAGNIVTPPPPIPDPIPVSLTADFNLTDGQTITTTSFEMDASASSGQGNNWDSYKWDVKPISPLTNKAYGVQPDGAYGGPKKMLLNIVDGTFEIVLTVKDKAGKTAQKKVQVNARMGAVPPKTVTGFDSATDLITYSDGSTERGIAILSNGKWVVKNSDGTIVNQ